MLVFKRFWKWLLGKVVRKLLDDAREERKRVVGELLEVEGVRAGEMLVVPGNKNLLYVKGVVDGEVEFEKPSACRFVRLGGVGEGVRLEVPAVTYRVSVDEELNGELVFDKYASCEELRLGEVNGRVFVPEFVRELSLVELSGELIFHEATDCEKLIVGEIGSGVELVVPRGVKVFSNEGVVRGIVRFEKGSQCESLFFKLPEDGGLVVVPGSVIELAVKSGMGRVSVYLGEELKLLREGKKRIAGVEFE